MLGFGPICSTNKLFPGNGEGIIRAKGEGTLYLRAKDAREQAVRLWPHSAIINLSRWLEYTWIPAASSIALLFLEGKVCV